MEVMWRLKSGTVRQVLGDLRSRRDLAYTTVMTIMNNLAGKGLLTRAPLGNAYVYKAALTREALLAKRSQEAVSDVLARFGDLAIANFVKAMESLPPERIERLRRLVEPPSSEADES